MSGTVADRFSRLAALRPGVVRPPASWLYEEVGTERKECIRAVTSWLVRIRLTRRNPGNHARFRQLRDEIKRCPRDRHKPILILGLRRDWPEDEEIQCAVESKPMKKAERRELARMVLEAIESELGGNPHSTDLEIEHIMP